MSSRIDISPKARNMTMEKAEILGFLTAEGEFHKREYLRHANDRKNIRLQKTSDIYFTNTEPVLIKKFMDDFKIVYNYSPFYDDRKKRCVIRRIAIFEDLKRYGKVNSYSWGIPKQITSIKKFIVSWLRGYFDGDGSVEFREKEGHYRVMAFSVNNKGLRQISSILKRKFGISSKIYSHIGKLVISGYQNLRTFYDDINFNHPSKIKKLSLIIKHFEGKL
jgi:hypothetical protein